MAMRPQPPLSRERPCCMPAAAASAAPTQPSDAEIARLDREARLRDRERDYEQRMEAMLQLRAKAAEGGGSGGGSRVGPHTLVSNPFLDLTEAQADRVFEMIEEIHHTGYAIYEGLCSPEEVAALNAGLPWDGVPRLSERLGDSRAGADEVMEPGDWKLGHDTKYGGRQTKHIHNVFAKTRAADAVACKPELLAVVAGVVGQHFQLSTTVISNPLPGSDPQGVHQDDGMFPLPRPHMPMLCNSLLALDDITVANGGTWIAKGSMTWEAGRRPLPEEISYLEMPAGSVACWDGGLFHAGGGNRTESDNRRILNLNFYRSWLRTQNNQFLQIPRELVLSLPPQLQRLLGYHKSMGVLGGADYQEPLDFLKRMVTRGGDGIQAELGYDAMEDPREAYKRAKERASKL